MLLNCGAGKDFWASLGQQEIKPVNFKGNPPGVYIGRTDTETESPVLWPPVMNSQFIGKDLDEGLKAERGKGGDRGWYGWMTSLILQSIGSQRIGHDLATEHRQP